MESSDSLYFILIGVLLLVFRVKFKYKHLGSMLNNYYNISSIILAIGSIMLGLFFLIKSII